jgi:hypothetical protein
LEPKVATHLGDFPLHDNEIGIIDIELDGLKQILNGLLGNFVPIEKILGHVRQRELQWRVSF